MRKLYVFVLLLISLSGTIIAQELVAATQKEVLRALFNGNNEDLMILRRNLRVARLPVAAVPPPLGTPGLVFNPIDQFIVAKWQDLTPAVCDDAAFLHRVYLDVIGVIPTIEEARKFLADASPDNRVKLVDELLARSDDYAAHWTPFWEEALGSSTTTVRGGIATRGNYRDWIYRNFVNNKPYDVMVAELIDPTMPGYRKPQQGDANGKILKVHYILNENHTDTIQSAANVAQVFLGTSMKCASCHDHFLNKEWPQARFLAFAGMFAPSDLEVIRCEKSSGQVVAAKFPFELPDAPSTVPQTEEGRLHRVAQLLTDPANPRFSKTIVNRLWKRYIGLGLFEPADDFRADQPSSHPELIEWLADDFMRHGYDLKHTIRLILTSRTYQLQYDRKLEDHFDVSQPAAPRYYASPSLRRLTAEQLLDSVLVATTQRLDPSRRIYLDKTSTALTRALGRSASRSEISTARPDDVAVVQSLELLNGQEFHDLIYAADILKDLAPQTDSGKIVDQLYWAALNRPPSQSERWLGVTFLRRSERRMAEAKPAPQEIVWLQRAPDPRPGTTESRYIDMQKPLPVGANDVLFADVTIDPANPPKEIRMQWQRGSQREFAYKWAGQAGSSVRVEIPVKDLHMRSDGEGLTGWLFDHTGGTVSWGKAGVLKVPADPAQEPLGDMLWALLASPESQYIR